MDEIKEFVDERQKSWCIHCGRWIDLLDTNRDHVPSRGLLLDPYPKNLPVVQICKRCNESFSLDEEYLIAFLNCVLAGSTDPEDQQNPRARRRLSGGRNLRRLIERAKTEFKTRGQITRINWKPKSDRVNRIISKNARGHAFYEYGEPMSEEPDYVWFAPLQTLTAEQRTDFETIHSEGIFPEVGSRMMTRIVTGQDLSGGWITVQKGTYRYALAQRGIMLVRSVLYDYLATEVCWGN